MSDAELRVGAVYLRRGPDGVPELLRFEGVEDGMLRFQSLTDGSHRPRYDFHAGLGWANLEREVSVVEIMAMRRKGEA